MRAGRRKQEEAAAPQELPDLAGCRLRRGCLSYGVFAHQVVKDIGSRGHRLRLSRLGSRAARVAAPLTSPLRLWFRRLLQARLPPFHTRKPMPQSRAGLCLCASRREAMCVCSVVEEQQ